jgi:hypothetical protein
MTEMDDNFGEQIKRAPITRTILFWKNYDRAGPVYWVFVFMLVASLIALSIFGGNLFTAVGFGLVLFCLVPVVVFVVSKIK